MLSHISSSRSPWRGLAAAGLVIGAMTIGSLTASAGECPADQRVGDGSGQAAGATMPKDVTDTVLGAIDVSQEPAQIADRQFRLRRLEIQPGGEVPWHSHADRPAIIYVVSGEVTEYASTCAVPIIHKAGEVAVETHVTSHWWKNTGGMTAVLLSADLLHEESDAHTM